MLHDDEHLRVGGHEVHGSSHALDHLPRNDPVGKVPVCSHLHGPQDRHVHFGPSDHAEGLRGGEERRARNHGDRLLSRINEVGIDLSLCRIRPDSEEPILALEFNAHPRLEVVAHERWHPNSEIDVHAVRQLFGCSPDDELSSLVYLDVASGGDRSLLYPLLVALALHYSVHIDAREVNLLRAKGAHRHDLLHFGDADLARSGAVWIEIPGCAFPNQVSTLVGLPGFDD
mmetsp:Transcript_48702/g.115951  ORF Transcript_48702/g.115951 Transcript_48702/m.115951 type:complete len:229 (-) Transcript_48702:638-1324(-)